MITQMEVVIDKFKLQILPIEMEIFTKSMD